jgi:hypothetical protein
MKTELEALPAMATPETVERAIRRCGEEFYRAVNRPSDTRAAQVLRAQRLAEVAERRARWWGVLIRWVFSPESGASWVIAFAALTAQKAEESEAKLWRETADCLGTEAITSIATAAGPRSVEFRSAS